MRKAVIYILVFCAQTVLLSCNTGYAGKKLTGGIRYSANSETKADCSMDKPLEKGGGLEIPAPREGSGEIILRRRGYTAAYNAKTLLPDWVAWELSADRLDGPAKRPQRAFHEDTGVAEPRAADADYRNSGYDRGHMCPAADNKWSTEAMYDSFLFTNICPQNHNLNVGDWNEMENQCRRWARRYGRIYVVCGPVLYKGKHKTIGHNRVVVPDAFFKVVLIPGKTPCAIGFIYKNVKGNRPKGDYVNTVDDVERITGIDFFPSLPDDVERVVEASVNLEKIQF